MEINIPFQMQRLLPVLKVNLSRHVELTISNRPDLKANFAVGTGSIWVLE